MIDVEAIKFSIGREIDAGLTLGVEDHAGGIDDSLLGRQGAEPIRDRIGADGGGQDTRGAGNRMECS
jgi:hypothetical protein